MFKNKNHSWSINILVKIDKLNHLQNVKNNTQL
jgi:hypothetical protein